MINQLNSRAAVYLAWGQDTARHTGPEWLVHLFKHRFHQNKCRNETTNLLSPTQNPVLRRNMIAWVRPEVLLGKQCQLLAHILMPLSDNTKGADALNKLMQPRQPRCVLSIASPAQS